MTQAFSVLANIARKHQSGIPQAEYVFIASTMGNWGNGVWVGVGVGGGGGAEGGAGGGVEWGGVGVIGARVA